MSPAKNRNFDINQFPKDWGMLVFPISMSRTSNTQAPESIASTLNHFLKKVTASRIGVHILYTEGLYMNFERDAYKTKASFAQNAVGHMNGVQRLVRKNYLKFQIESAFHFESWFQMYLSHKNFFEAFKGVQTLYQTDQQFRACVARDARQQKKRLTRRQIAFYLEEHTFVYLLINRQFNILNPFVNGRESWILLCYPGKPPSAQIYLYQQDPLKLNHDTNPYKGQYNTQSAQFFDYTRLNPLTS